jgi:adenine-specific DNA-methyltransferase
VADVVRFVAHLMQGASRITDLREKESMTASMEKFQSLVRELFQFDCADLDFGIYRIMNHKRAVIDRFIAEDLPRLITEELERGALAEQSEAQEALAAARQKVLDALGEDAVDAAENLAEKYCETKAGKEYVQAQAKAAGSRSHEALEAAVYNYLFAFFSRYWQDGDFISKRRYSKKERYAIPYNGEEVYLYWANHDQYYIKTGEYFTDYTYKAPNGLTVHFKLQQADVEQNNVKGERRFFLVRLDGIVWDEAERQLTIPFEYRPLTAQEAITYAGKNQQETINTRAVDEILKRLKKTPEALAALVAERRRAADDKPVSYLEHHLRQYTRRNTSDFFIHKDLKGFLSRELDFYLKNEVLNLEEMETAGETVAEGWFQMMRLIKKVGSHIIEFLAQIEGFQKMLWEKRKFVTETFYSITVGNIPKSFYPEIAACETQWEEWKELIAIAAPKAVNKRIELLKSHPTLVTDTRYFSQDFTERLLASYNDLDVMTDGLLMHSENWQALNLLQAKYGQRIECVHIDPPYNTQTSGFLYKNDY